MTTDKDALDKDLEQKTNQVDPDDEIEDEEDLADEIEGLIGSLEDLKTPTENRDWATAITQADEIQDNLNRIHVFIAGKNNG